MRTAAACRTPARPLPRPIRPYKDETTPSLIRRLETANTLRPGWLRALLKGSRRPWIESLAVWTDHDPVVLALAMPQLGMHDPDPSLRRKVTGRPTRTTHTVACHRCTLARGAGRYVEIYSTHEQVICPHHGLWVGDGASPTSSPSAPARRSPRPGTITKTSSPGTGAPECARPSTSPVSSTGDGTTSSNTSPQPRKSTTRWLPISRLKPTVRPSWRPRSTLPSSTSPRPWLRLTGPR